MNEKIKQLAQQAGVIALSENGIAPPLSLFAQLIVRECVAICQDTDGEEDAMALCGRLDCAVEIQEHFGVE
jgi:hypothetical protein